MANIFSEAVGSRVKERFGQLTNFIKTQRTAGEAKTKAHYPQIPKTPSEGQVAASSAIPATSSNKNAQATPVRQYTGGPLQPGLSTPNKPAPVQSTVQKPTDFTISGGITDPAPSGLGSGDIQASTDPTPQVQAPAPAQPQQNIPSPTSALQAQIAALQSQVTGGTTPTADEQRIQSEITALKGAANMAISGEEGQGRGRELNLVRGRQGQITDQANLRLQTLTGELGNIQAQREAEQQAALTQLGFLQNQQSALTPFESNGALVQYDPTTGQVTTLRDAPTETADGFTLSPGQARYDAQGNVVAYAPDDPTTTGAPSIQDINGVDHQWNAATNSWESLAGFGESGQVDTTAIASLQDKISLIDDLIASDGLTGSVGSYGISRFTPFSADKGARQEFAAGVNQLISKETIDTLVSLKERGGTLGALSDQERVMLQNAASKIGSWTQYDDNGIATGKFEISEEAFITELNTIKTLAQRALESAGGSGTFGATGATPTSFDSNALRETLSETKTSAGQLLTPDEVNILMSDAETLASQGVPIEDIRLRINQELGFSSDLGTSQNGSSVLDLGTITGYGSPLWEHGLDIDLKIGDPVPSPANGKVVFVGENGGFGGQVQIQTPNGDIIWLSHLSGSNVSVGDAVQAGQNVALGGNSGNTIPGKGGDGSHLDLTITKAGGGYYTPREIEQMLKA